MAFDPATHVSTSRASRRRARTERAEEQFGSQSDAALDLLELLDLAWHDCFGDPAPPDSVLDDVWRSADSDLGRLASAALLAVVDWRDLRVNARAGRPPW